MSMKKSVRMLAEQSKVVGQTWLEFHYSTCVNDLAPKVPPTEESLCPKGMALHEAACETLTTQF